MVDEGVKVRADMTQRRRKWVHSIAAGYSFPARQMKTATGTHSGRWPSLHRPADSKRPLASSLGRGAEQIDFRDAEDANNGAVGEFDLSPAGGFANFVHIFHAAEVEHVHPEFEAVDGVETFK